jgi:ferritin-like metal-binding protein YciE
VEQQEMSRGAGMAGAADKHMKTIADYVGDMVALETHIEAALDRQLNEVKDDPIALEAVRGFHQMVKSHRDELTALQDEVGSTAGNPIKKAGSALLGAAAGVIDMVRTEANSKALRDDYTAFNLAAMGYTMLYTTSTALGSARVADISARNLRDYAGAVQRINHIVPDVVVAELTKDGHSVAANVADRTRKMVDQAWQETDQAV